MSIATTSSMLAIFSLDILASIDREAGSFSKSIIYIEFGKRGCNPPPALCLPGHHCDAAAYPLLGRHVRRSACRQPASRGPCCEMGIGEGSFAGLSKARLKLALYLEVV